MPWSIPAATATGFAAGVAVGEVAGQIAKGLGASERVERIVRQAAHSLTSTGVQWAINTTMLDPVGAAAAPAAAVAGSQVHQMAYDLFTSSQSPAPNPAI
jgi:hypothetical protein